MPASPHPRISESLARTQTPNDSSADAKDDRSHKDIHSQPWQRKAPYELYPWHLQPLLEQLPVILKNKPVRAPAAHGTSGSVATRSCNPHHSMIDTPDIIKAREKAQRSPATIRSSNHGKALGVGVIKTPSPDEELEFMGQIRPK
jgi:hypothetical protein